MSNTIVATLNGQVKGTQIDGVAVWKGIPYAKAPLGSLRFRPPEPTTPWKGIYEATKFGPSAIQPPSEIMAYLGDTTTETSEDCLYLNIWSPQADDKRRPVMVWIHGGAFLNGSGTSASYDGTSFATEGDVVVVTINYRLGVFGFLHLGDISGEEYEGSGNCGILDQVAALKWIKENIAAFGGDPNNITVFGESAGAMSIGILLAIPSAKGLFNKAILQSGASNNILSAETAKRVTGGIMAALGIGANDLSKLEDLPTETLLNAAQNIPLMALGPVLDGVVITEHPEEALAKGSSKDIPVLIGTNKDEYRLFTFFDPTWKQLDAEGIESRFEKSLRKVWPTISAEYVDKEALNQTLFDELMTFDLFTHPAIRLAERQIEQDTPVWMYRFDWETPVLNGGLKACHALEIPFVWNHIDKPGAANLIGPSPSRSIAYHMHKAWINFARNGNPNTEGMPNWPKYGMEKRSTIIFNAESTVEEDPNEKERLIWEKSLAVVRQ